MSSALSQAKALAKYNNKMERENVKLQAQYNSQLAQDNRDWQEEMSNTAHQREIKDLKLAGLNPVLSVTGGQGATTPSGSAASVSKANTDMSLPAKVMDMAIATMNNANAIRIAEIQGDYALKVAEAQQETAHDTSPYYGLSEGDLGDKLAALLPYVGPLLSFLPYVGGLVKGAKVAKGAGKVLNAVSKTSRGADIFNSAKLILNGVPYTDTILYANKESRQFKRYAKQKAREDASRKRFTQIVNNRRELYDSTNGYNLKYLKKLLSDKKYWIGK